ncbi:hypothetical protein HF282_06665, partial [Acidithiobacillus ferrooxidans]|nr:hypothetical protein [Acidithiobacillus ferrooxidans]
MDTDLLPYAAYNNRAIELLSRMQAIISEQANDAVESFYRSLNDIPEAQSIISILSEDDFAFLKRKQVQHLLLLLSPGIAMTDQALLSRSAGYRHASIGVDQIVLKKASEHYLKYLLNSIERHDFSIFYQLVTMRLAFDIKSQIDGYKDYELYYINAIDGLGVDPECIGPVADVNACARDMARRLVQIPFVEGVVIGNVNGEAVDIFYRLGITPGVDRRTKRMRLELLKIVTSVWKDRNPVYIQNVENCPLLDGHDMRRCLSAGVRSIGVWPCQG